MRAPEVTPARAAFLSMIAAAEGTSTSPATRADGYDIVVGGTRFLSYADHPRQRVWIPRINDYSTAAGRYQLLQRFWDHYRALLGLQDFGPASQDAVALQQIREFKALDDVDACRVEDAINKVRTLWASFPGAGHGQHEQRLGFLLDHYRRAGGTPA